MIDYSYIIKENHEDIRKPSENVKIPLSKEDKAFRKGYLTARSDSAKAYCHKKGIKRKRTFKRRSKR